MKNIPVIIALIFLFTACDTEKTYYIADHYGDGDTLLYRENTTDAWQPFHGELHGFDYTEGYEYKVKVKVSGEKDHLTYQLISVESKTKTDYAERMKELTGKLNGNWDCNYIDVVKKLYSPVHFSIDGDKINLMTGCNKFFGEVNYNPYGSFGTAHITGTKKYCPDFAKIEKALVNALNSVKKYTLKGDRLELLDAGGKIMMKATKKPDNALLDGKWVVTSIEKFMNTTGESPEFTIHNGQVTGTTACNDFNATLDITGNHLQFRDILATKKYCPRTIQVEKAFMKALKQAAKYQTEKDLTHFFDDQGNALFTAMLRK